jgi:hypothetical protein
MSFKECSSTAHGSNPLNGQRNNVPWFNGPKYSFICIQRARGCKFLVGSCTSYGVNHVWQIWTAKNRICRDGIPVHVVTWTPWNTGILLDTISLGFSRDMAFFNMNLAYFSMSIDEPYSSCHSLVLAHLLGSSNSTRPHSATRKIVQGGFLSLNRIEHFLFPLTGYWS